MLPAGYHIQKPFVITFSKIYDTIGVSASPFICLCLCICLCICICICICLCIWIFVRIWIADIMGFQKIYDLRGPWGLTALFQLIYELRKNCCGWTEIEGSIRGPRGPKNGAIMKMEIKQNFLRKRCQSFLPKVSIEISYSTVGVMVQLCIYHKSSRLMEL